MPHSQPIQNTQKKHAKFSASGAARWLACPGSIKLTEKAPPQRESRYAEEGTKAHEVLELIIKSHIKRTKPYSTARSLEGVYPREMVKYALDAYKWIENELLDGNDLISETKVEFPGVGFGTVDCAILDHFGTLTVIDFKYGAGIPVSPEENPQLIYYAIGLCEKYGWDFSDCRLVIIQPRAMEGNTIKQWGLSIEELKRWKEILLKGVRFANAKTPILVPYNSAEHGDEDHCRFCPAAVICPELRDKSLKEIKAEFDSETGTIAVPTNQKIAVDNLGTILSACNRLETWIEKIKENALQALEAGEEVEGWKLVKKRSIRRWIDIEKAAAAARKLYGKCVFTEPELMSPAQFEKKVLQVTNDDSVSDFFKKFVTDESSGVTIAPSSDKREAYNMFTDEFKEPTKPKGKKRNGRK